MAADRQVVRLDLGYFVRPAEETRTGAARVEPVLGYAVLHEDGVMLLDTGMGQHPDVDARYRPRRRALAEGLSAQGLTVEDISVVVNCHLHFDHCGGNPLLAGRPIVVQVTELAAAQGEGYTLAELVDAPGLIYEQVSGDAEVLPGVLVVPTPGHTDGHQSVVVSRRDGTVIVLAGQSHDTATAYGADVLAVRAARDHHGAPLPIAPGWVARLGDLDPKRVYFAHDQAVWTPS